jgi:hypothetical protein
MGKHVTGKHVMGKHVMGKHVMGKHCHAGAQGPMAGQGAGASALNGAQA